MFPVATAKPVPAFETRKPGKASQTTRIDTPNMRAPKILIAKLRCQLLHPGRNSESCRHIHCYDDAIDNSFE
jgi:hypothetical protein